MRVLAGLLAAVALAPVTAGAIGAANEAAATPGATVGPGIATAAAAAEAIIDAGVASAGRLAAVAPTPHPTDPAMDPALGGPAPIDLRSETLVVEHKKRRALFGGGVVATRGELILKCPEVEARYDGSSRISTVRCLGPVIATEGDRTMRAAAGVFDNHTGILSLHGEPTFTEGERRLSGETLEYETATGVVRLVKAEGLIPAEEAPDLPGKAGRGPLMVKADTIAHDLHGRLTTFEGGVVATRGDLVLHASRLVATYDEDDKLSQAITSGGPVTVRQGERRGKAQRAIFSEGAHRLVLDGAPTVVDAGSSLSGTRVTFLLGQDRVVVDQPRAVFPLSEALPGRQK